MKRYSVAAMRERLAQALDEAERGVPVIIERRGIRYRLIVEPQATPRARRRPRIDVLDAAVLDGRWGWVWTSAGLEFRDRKS